MKNTHNLDRCLAILNAQFQPPAPAHGGEHPFVHSITISRQSGCGAHLFAEELAALLQARLPQGVRPWTVFDRSLVEAVLKDHHLPARLASFMPEDKVGQLNDIIEHLFSLHPPTETLVRRASETILHLAQLGNAILVGRGGNVITASLPGMLHLRLIGSLESRVAHFHQFDHLDRKEALERIQREDGGRRRYFREYFHKDIDDPLLYHFVINTDWVTREDAARTIAAYALNHTAPRAAKVSPAPSKAG